MNVAYTAGNVSSYHRQVREGIVPIIDMLYNNPRWCFSIEMCGQSIDFIGKNYPSVLDRFKELILRNQIEFISSTYAPQIWISFPRTDLIKSIEMNISILEKYGIKQSRIFFAQENFSGEGIKTLTKWFDIAILKNDYYYYLHNSEKYKPLSPYYNLEGLKVLIGGGHIMESISDFLLNESTILDGNALLIKNEFEPIFSETLNTVNKKKTEIDVRGKYNDTKWLWFHIGSSERFGKPNMRPENVAFCRFNLRWFILLEEQLKNLEQQGFIFSSINQFIQEIETSNFSAPDIKPLLDGAWNMEMCKGGYFWTGYNYSDAEDDILVRNQNWRSRSKLLAVEEFIKHFPKNIQTNAKLTKELQKAWEAQLLSEVSDSTGWFPDVNEVNVSIVESDKVLNYVANISNYLKLCISAGSIVVDTKAQSILARIQKSNKAKLSKIEKHDLLIDEPKLLGMCGEMAYYELSNNIQRIVVDFSPIGQQVGVEFALKLDYIIFSPALMDDEAVSYSTKLFSPKVIYLPLPNGLIGVQKDVFLIKHNEFLNIAGCVNCTENTLSFKIENPQKRKYHWEVTVFRGNLEAAIELARSINVNPIIDL